MIDLRKSAELNGMEPIELYVWFDKYPRSNKMVICYCDGCGETRERKYSNYYDLCSTCANNDPVKKQENSINVRNRYSDQKNRDITGEKSKEYWSHQENRDAATERSNEYWSHQENRDDQSKRLLNSDKRKILAIEQSQDPEFGRKVSAGKQGISYDDWEDYAKNQLYCPDFNEKCRESNREKYDRLCFLSGLPEEENLTKNGDQWKLSVHHVDMDKGQGCNDIRWKLVPLCMNWHGKVHNELWEARIIWLLDNVWNKN